METTYELCVQAAFRIKEASKRMDVPIEIFIGGMELILRERDAGKSIEDCKQSARQYLKVELPKVLQGRLPK